MMEKYNWIKLGVQVYWRDPERRAPWDIIYTVDIINSEDGKTVTEDDNVITISNGFSEVEVTPDEISPALY